MRCHAASTARALPAVPVGPAAGDATSRSAEQLRHRGRPVRGTRSLLGPQPVSQRGMPVQPGESESDLGRVADGRA